MEKKKGLRLLEETYPVLYGAFIREDDLKKAACKFQEHICKLFFERFGTPLPIEITIILERNPADVNQAIFDIEISPEGWRNQED